MKKIFTFLMAIVIGISAWATERPVPSKEMRQKAVKVQYTKPVKEIQYAGTFLTNPGLKSVVAFDETDLGVTKYDLQTNASLSNRFYMYPEGHMAHVWTIGLTPGSYPDRGTGYNYYNGTNWQPAPTTRIETSRTGWPSYAPAGMNGEAVIAHTATDLLYTKRDNRFSGAWASTSIAGPPTTEPAWPRMTASGTDNQYLHYIVNSYTAYNNQTTALMYSRSSDGGQTWDMVHQVFDDLGPDYYVDVNGDAYAMASKGNTVAFVVGDAWMDLVLMKSTDNGETWDKTVVWQHPYPMYDFSWDTDTFYCVNNSISLDIDKDGLVHVAFGVCKVQGNSDQTYNYWPGVDGIVYWNENRPTFSENTMALCPYGYDGSELTDNYNLIGWAQDVNGNGTLDIVGDLISYRALGLSGMPNIHVDDDDNVYIAYSSITEGYDNGTNTYRHIWVRMAADKGERWSGTFTDLMADIVHIFDEGIYPLLGNISDENIYIVYNTDPNPGLALNPGTAQHEPIDNHQIYVVVPKDQLGVGISEKPAVQVSNPYPNPASDLVYLSVTTERNAPVQVTLTNLAGQNIRSYDFGNRTAGTHLLSINTSGLNHGFYLCTVYSGAHKVTHRIVIQ